MTALVELPRAWRPLGYGAVRGGQVGRGQDGLRGQAVAAAQPGGARQARARIAWRAWRSCGACACRWSMSLRFRPCRPRLPATRLGSRASTRCLAKNTQLRLANDLNKNPPTIRHYQEGDRKRIDATYAVFKLTPAPAPAIAIAPALAPAPPSLLSASILSHATMRQQIQLGEQDRLLKGRETIYDFYKTEGLAAGLRKFQGVGGAYYRRVRPWRCLVLAGELFWG